MAAGQPALLPFVPLMRGERSALAQAAERLRAVPDEGKRHELQLHFLVLGGLRYDMGELLGLLGGTTMIRLEQLRESSVYQMILEEGERKGLEQGLERGLAQGREEGREEGRAEGREEGLGLGLDHERLLMTRLLHRKFGVLSPEVVSRVQALGRDALERLADDLFDLPDVDALAVWLDHAE